MKRQSTTLEVSKAAVSGFILERTAKRMKQAFQRVLSRAQCGITVDQWVVLQALNKKDRQTQQAIAAAVYKDPPTLTRIIDLLCKKGLTCREQDPDDRRSFRIALTENGKAKINQVLPLLVRFREQAWNGLTHKEVEQMVRSLDKVFDNLGEI